MHFYVKSVKKMQFQTKPNEFQRATTIEKLSILNRANYKLRKRRAMGKYSRENCEERERTDNILLLREHFMDGIISLAVTLQLRCAARCIRGDRSTLNGARCLFLEITIIDETDERIGRDREEREEHLCSSCLVFIIKYKYRT